MDKYHLDALVATSPENNLYVSDMCSHTQQYLREALFFSILSYSGEVAVVVPISDIDTFVYKDLKINDVRCYGEFFLNIAEDFKQATEIEKKLIRTLKKVKRGRTAENVLIEVLKEKGLDTKNIGIDESGISYRTLMSIKNKIPESKIVEASSIFREVRMIKTSREITLLKKAIEICEKAVNSAFSIAREGVAETDLSLNFYN
ncbi:MAG: aminopeptidase P family N-terminal domain-containing protein, partial [Candidatus Freyarchaeota archaeon]|nr:aminopeptidase P family N-terminal domain-containing protein [Candidatus Jordarchaeia archaeon]